MAIVTKLDNSEAGRARLRLLSPANKQPIGDIECMTPADVQQALEAAKQAQPAWAALSFKERGAYVMRALDYLVNHQDELVDISLQETPKPRAEALMMDIFAGSDALHYYAKNAEKILKPERASLHGIVGIGKKCTIHYKPLGVVGVISPWNGPFILSLNPTVQALMAGNTVLLKPSSATPFSGGFVGKIFEAAGLPKGVLQVTQGNSATGQALLECGVNKISFTGSEDVGRHVAKCCAERFIPCTLELGGKNAMIVCADADLDRAAAGGVAGNFFNAGQYCGGIERIYVMDSVADAFTEKVVAIASKLRQATEGEFDVGALYTQEQFDIVVDHVDDARAKGAKVLCGGRPNPALENGLYYEPTVLTDVTMEMKCLSEETFGPVMNIVRVRDEEEAIRSSNSLNYGLTGSVWTKNIRKGIEIGKRLETGSVDINDFPQTYGSIEVPFGGRKASGVGQVNGPAGLKGYCHALPVQVDRFGGKQTSGVFPRDGSQDEGFQKFVRFLWGNPIGRMISMVRLPF